MKIQITLALVCALGAASASAQWKYSSSIDKMSSERTSEAQLVSDQSISLKFPYAGDNFAGLVVRKRGAASPDVLFIVEQGQLMCRINDCSIRLKFDDGNPTTVSGTKPSDHSSNAMFLNKPAQFIASAKKAKKILVEADFFRQGTHIIEFTAPSPLEWK